MLATWLKELLNEELQRQGPSGMVVWYDPSGTLSAIAEQAVPEGARFLRFDGSYLALRFELENADPELQGRWVVYVPEAPPTESWLRDWELLGSRKRMDLLELLSQKANLPITQRLTDLLHNRPNNARDLVRDWGNLMSSRPVNEANLLDALLALGFGLTGWQLEEALLRFLNGDVGREQLQERGLWEVFKERIANWTGWRAVPDDQLALQKHLEAAILLSELVSFAPDLTNRFAEVLPTEPRRPAAAHLARLWRDRENFRDRYLQASQRVERDYELGSVLMLREELLSAETFPVIDELWRREVRGAIAPDGSNFHERAERIYRIADQRRQLFWGRQGRAPFWEPIALAAQLYLGCKSAIAQADQLLRLGEFVQHYTADRDGWWQLDLWALKLAAKAAGLDAEARRRFLSPTWGIYRDYLDRVNRRFAEAIQREGWHPTQPTFWSKFVSSVQRTAVFFVDALRYDLAQHLKGLLEGNEFTVTLRSLQSVLPSITEVGMAALLPEAERGLHLSVEGNRLSIRLSGQEVGNYRGRREWLEQWLGQRGRVLNLDEVERTEWGNEAMVVVLSREIDEFGTFAADLNPQGLLEMVGRVVRAMQNLREKGFDRFLVVADHGFLFLPPELQIQSIRTPSANICRRRFAVGAVSEGCLTLRAQQIGLEGEVVFAFPVGLTVFALPGPTEAFLHGGVSLQENIVPVLEATAVPGSRKVAVEMDLPQALTSRIAIVMLRVREPHLFATPRRVVVDINGKRSEPQEMRPDQQPTNVSVHWLGFDETVPRQVTVRLLDADTGQVLQEQLLPVEMIL